MIVVLRLGHRLGRDARISTHCGLVSRVLGAKKIIYTGEKDEQLLTSIKNASENWGGNFSAEYAESYRKIITFYKKKKFLIVHSTMYGISLQKKIKKIRKHRNVMFIVGGEKVPSDVYQMADMNIAVANQPHSEIAALAIFMHDYFRGKELDNKFIKAKLKIIPMERGKKVINNKPR
ncbi:MAG: tRNA (cytidine(56)-2'-O)-methyltransferase [Candidatus Aenigmatarchaeota archaeon]